MLDEGVRVRSGNHSGGFQAGESVHGEPAQSGEVLGCRAGQRAGVQTGLDLLDEVPARRTRALAYGTARRGQSGAAPYNTAMRFSTEPAIASRAAPRYVLGSTSAWSAASTVLTAPVKAIPRAVPTLTFTMPASTA